MASSTSGRTKKRKSTDTTSACSESKKRQNCVIHYLESKSDTFVFFSDIKNPEKRLEKLNEIRLKRLAEPNDSLQRMAETCELIPEKLVDEHGYHRDCYQRFTKNLNRIGCSDMSEITSAHRSSRRTSTEPEHTLFKPDCIFCNKDGKKKVKVKGAWTTEGTVKFASDGWQTVVDAANIENDEKLLTRIRGRDLFACEARYHRTCRSNYIQNPGKWRSGHDDQRTEQADKEEAHRVAFAKTREVIDREIITNRKVLKLSDLNDQYILALIDSQFPNPNHRSEKLKSKLEKCDVYSSNLSFCKLDDKGKFQSYLVFNSSVDTATAVKRAYELGSADMVSDVAVYLRKLIVEAFEKSSSLTWPPTATYLESININEVMPAQLNKFLCYIMSGKPQSNSTKVNWLVNSIGQDICRVVTNGQWKLPKHILICMTLRHLFRSAELITLINRFGHSESYTFSLELETAIAKSVQQTSDLLSTQIIRNPTVPSVFHSEFDNFDQLLNTLTGKGSIHTAHGIMMQDLDGELNNTSVCEAPTVPKTKERSLKITSDERLPDCYVTNRKSPDFTIKHRTYPDCESAMFNARRKNMTWLLLRMQRSQTNTTQEVPGWTGFISSTGEKPCNLTTIDYYPVIAHPITDYKTVSRMFEVFRKGHC